MSWFDKAQQKELLEKLSELEHLQWSHWTRHFLEFQNLLNVAYWKSLAHAPYSKLSEKQKDSDREWARKTLKLFNEVLGDFQKTVKEEFGKFPSRPSLEWGNASPQQVITHRNIFQEWEVKVLEWKRNAEKLLEASK